MFPLLVAGLNMGGGTPAAAVSASAGVALFDPSDDMDVFDRLGLDVDPTDDMDVFDPFP